MAVSHRGAIFVLVTVALWTPVLRLLLLHDLGIEAALVRMAVGVVIARTGVGLVSRVVAHYQVTNENRSPDRRRGDDQLV